MGKHEAERRSRPGPATGRAHKARPPARSPGRPTAPGKDRPPASACAVRSRGRPSAAAVPAVTATRQESAATSRLVSSARGQDGSAKKALHQRNDQSFGGNCRKLCSLNASGTTARTGMTIAGGQQRREGFGPGAGGRHPTSDKALTGTKRPATADRRQRHREQRHRSRRRQRPVETLVDESIDQHRDLSYWTDRRAGPASRRSQARAGR